MARVARVFAGVVLLATGALPGFAPGAAHGQPPPPPPPPLPAPPEPAANPITPEKAVLGKILFWDEQLSSSNTVACGTCHRAEFGGSDPRTLRTPGPDGVLGTADDIFGSPGVILSDENNDYRPHEDFGFEAQVTGRATPSFIGAQYFTELFWDGRATSRFVDPETGATSIPAGGGLESQAVGPPLSDVEMAHVDRDWDEITAKLADARPLALATDLPPDTAAAIAAAPSYPALFADAFGDGEITAERIAMALATYQRILVPNQSPWDRFNAGEPGALTPAQQRGLGVFAGPGRCGLCHTAPLFADDDFHTLGVRPPIEDLGREAITGDPADRGSFKTPTLRNVGLRPRYMHNGGFATLDQVVAFYNGGGGNPINRDPLLRPLGLSPAQRADLVAFLEGGLTDPRVAAGLPPFDRPTLLTERAPDPEVFGAGNPGAGGVEPRLLAEAPPVTGNPDFRLGVRDGLGGATAILGISTAPADPGFEIDGVPVHIDITAGLRRVKTTLDGAGPGAGHATFSKEVPDRADLVGRTFYGQWFVKDPAATGGLSATPGVRLVIR